MLLEITLADLYQSALDYNPNTTKRQYAVDPVKIVKLDWYPYPGMKTLFIVGRVQSSRTPLRHNEPPAGHGHHTQPIEVYTSQLLFKGVKYHDEPTPITRRLVDNSGQTYNIEVLTPNHEVRVHCNCPDHNWRFRLANKEAEASLGPRPKPYTKKTDRPPLNPDRMPGMCKHLMKLLKVVRDSGLLIK